jgi:hypothetical protein
MRRARQTPSHANRTRCSAARPTVGDPQADEDQQIQCIKRRATAKARGIMSTDGSPASELVALWMTYAQHSRLAARTQDTNGDTFGAQLSQARADIRQAAAELLVATPDPQQAAAEMHRRATALWELDLPFVGFDAAAVTYTKARVWQDCARTINPALSEVQARLEWS